MYEGLSLLVVPIPDGKQKLLSKEVAIMELQGFPQKFDHIHGTLVRPLGERLLVITNFVLMSNKVDGDKSSLDFWIQCQSGSGILSCDGCGRFACSWRRLSCPQANDNRGPSGHRRQHQLSNTCCSFLAQLLASVKSVPLFASSGNLAMEENIKQRDRVHRNQDR